MQGAVQRLWQRMHHDELLHAHRMERAFGRHMLGSRMNHSPVPYQIGQVVTPLVAHMPQHENRAARVVGVDWSQPFYVLDFGDGRPHRWYAHNELQVLSAGAFPGLEIPGVTIRTMEH